MSNHTTPTAPTLSAPELARLEPLRPLNVQVVNAAMQEYQHGLQAILADSDYQTFADRGGEPKRFVKRSGWRKVATWFTLDLLVGRIDVERDERGDPLRATVVGRVVAPNGRIAEDVGACSITERRFSKPDHDLIATATTRALNRATSNLVGMGEVTAEEIGDEIESLLPEWAQEAGGELREQMTAKLAELVGDARADAFTRAAAARYGYVPNVATGFVNAIHSMLSASAGSPTGEES